MTGSDILIFLLGDDEALREWLLLRDGAVADRGSSFAAAAERFGAPERRRLRIALGIPGSLVAVHWLELPVDLAPAQRAAAARLAVAGAAAQLAETLHVAVGLPDSGNCAVALVDAGRMAGWVAQLQSAGFDPEFVIPQPLLLAPAAEGFVRHDPDGGLPLFRGPADAFSLEPDLAAHIVAGAPVERIDRTRFEAGLAAQIAEPAVNLRQGRFARRRSWAVEKGRLRRLLLLALAALLVLVAVQVTAMLRYTFAADAIEAELGRVAGEALGRDVVLSDPGMQLDRRLAELGEGGAQFDALAGGLFAAVRATPNAQLVVLDYDARGTLRASVAADSPATLDALRQRIEASGVTASAGPLATEGGQPRAEISVRVR